MRRPADEKTTLTFKNVAFTRFDGGMEKVVLVFNQPCVPKVFSIEEGNPRVVMDVAGVSHTQVKSLHVNAGAQLVKKVRSYLDPKTKRLRIVLDMDPAKRFLVSPGQDHSGHYTFAITEEKGPSWSRGDHITMLSPDPKPETEEESPVETPSNLAAPRILKGMQNAPSLAQGRSQLSAGAFAAAVDTLTAFLVAHPQESLAYRLRGNAYDNLGDRQRAIEDWTQAARLGDVLLPSYLDFLQVEWREKSGSVTDLHRSVGSATVAQFPAAGTGGELSSFGAR